MLIYPGDTPDVQGPPIKIPASNNAKNPNADPYQPEGNGPVPEGTFKTGGFVEKGGDVNSRFGIGFIPIYLGERTGVGIHAGRQDRGFRHPTQGCIRTTEAGLDFLRSNPITSITINPRP